MSLGTNRYRDTYHSRIKGEIKKFDLHLREEIKEIRIPAILENPQIGKNCRGNFPEFIPIISDIRDNRIESLILLMKPPKQLGS